MLEKDFQRKVIRDLKTLKNTWFYKASDRVKSGIPDIILCVNGKFIAIELKAPGGQATPLQEHTLGLIEEAGGITSVVWPVGWPALFHWLETISNE